MLFRNKVNEQLSNDLGGVVLDRLIDQKRTESLSNENGSNRHQSQLTLRTHYRKPPQPPLCTQRASLGFERSSMIGIARVPREAWLTGLENLAM